MVLNLQWIFEKEKVSDVLLFTEYFYSLYF